MVLPGLGRDRVAQVAGALWQLLLWIVDVHINNKCAEQLSRCINLLLLLRCLCAQEGVRLITGDFNKGVQRSKHAEDSNLEDAFAHAPVPWPSLGNSPLCWAQVYGSARLLCSVKLQHTSREWLKQDAWGPSMSIPLRSDSGVPASLATTDSGYTFTLLGYLPPDGARSNSLKTSRTQRRHASCTSAPKWSVCRPTTAFSSSVPLTWPSSSTWDQH